MSRFFFDTRDEGAVLLDEVGVELVDIDAARKQAAASLAELAADVLPGALRRTLRVDVRDETEQVVLITELVFKTHVLTSKAS